MISRTASEVLLRLANQFPVIGITGPRQSGKTTLAKSLFPNKKYISFDDKTMRDIAKSNPHDFLLAFPHGAIFDEAQKVPEIFDAIKLTVDQGEYTPGKYILTGSSQFRLRQNMTDSLAGRAAFVKLLPFSLEELKSESLLPVTCYDLIFKGQYPPLHDSTKHFLVNDWLESYIDTYIDLDVKDQINPSNLSVFKRFLTICATLSGQMLSMDSIARDVGVSAPTIKNWLSILETSYIIHFLTPAVKNIGKSLVKTPKLYFIDTGLLCHLLRIESVEDLILSPYKGAIVETFAVAELLKKRMHSGKQPNLTFYRETTGLEVDVIADWNENYAIEVKSDSFPEKKLSGNIKKYIALNAEISCSGVVFYLGDISMNVGGVNYVSWRDWSDFSV